MVVIGAGVAGLAATLELAARGCKVTLLERAPVAGGKLRTVSVGGVAIDAGPTVLTLRAVFDELFAAAGARLDDHLKLVTLEVLARHAWPDGSRLDLFSDPRRTADAIGAFAGAPAAAGYLKFCARAERVYRCLERPFMHAARPTPASLVRAAGIGGLADLWSISPFTTLWSELGTWFSDVRLRQLFARYATYCGSSPFAAPATLMLVAHAERSGVWCVEGGMQRIAAALSGLALAQGAGIRLSCHVARVLTARGRVDGVELDDGERLPADAVVAAVDCTALATGQFGPDVASAVPAQRGAARSLSAVTCALRAEADGFPLEHHNVFFSGDYRAEFDDIYRHAHLPREPTVYVCAEDRGPGGERDLRAPERLLCLVNAPAIGDSGRPDAAEIERCLEQTWKRLAESGLTLRASSTPVVTGPADFARLFPATGGALYGLATHGWQASFRRPPARTRIPGLFLAGGSVHPGPGIPMAAISGRLAATAVLEDLRSTHR